MFLDLDKFKPVKMTAFGHAVGDLMLKEVTGCDNACGNLTLYAGSVVMSL